MVIKEKNYLDNIEYDNKNYLDKIKYKKSKDKEEFIDDGDSSVGVSGIVFALFLFIGIPLIIIILKCAQGTL